MRRKKGDERKRRRKCRINLEKNRKNIRKKTLDVVAIDNDESESEIGDEIPAVYIFVKFTL